MRTISTSHIKNSRSFLPKRKQLWPDPEASIDILCGTIKGKYSYWEAKGPAQEAYERIRAEIQEVLNCSCSPVRCSSAVNYDIYMVGRIPEMAVPHIMFSCKQPESRKQAVAAVRKSGILDCCPPGIDLGHWDCPPHIVNLQLLASNWQPQGDKLNKQASSYGIQPIFDAQKNSRLLAMRLVQTGLADTARSTLKTATIGSFVEIGGKKFYLAPEHIFEFDAYQTTTSGNGEDVIDDNDCEFGAFLDDDITVEEAEFMSQYSLSPPASDDELNSDSDYDGAFGDEEPDECPLTTPSPAGSVLINKSDRKETMCSDALLTEVGSADLRINVPMFSSKDLDYVLIEADQTEYLASDLPILSRESVAKVKAGRVYVTTVTGSGHFLRGTLSGRPSYIRLPNATKFQEVYTVQFDGPLLPGDSGSIICDSNTGMIYGHIIAGSVETRVAYIIPADTVLADLEMVFENNCCPRTTSEILPQVSTVTDPLGVAASIVSTITFAVQSAQSLYETIQVFRYQNIELRRLKDELEGLTEALDLLTHAVDTEVPVLVFLQGPIDRCTQVCRELEQSMKTFSRKPKRGFRDWTKVKFMGGDINDFINIIAAYKSTIAVGVGTITMHTSKVSYQVLQEYNEMTENTSYDLEVYLQQINERLAQLVIEIPDTSTGDINSTDLNNEREVTKQCLRICEDVRSYIESLTNRESTLLQETTHNDAEDDMRNCFQAQLLTRQALD